MMSVSLGRMEGDPGAAEKLYRLRLVLPDLSQSSYVGNWLATLEKSIPPELFHDFDELFDAPERKSGKNADVKVFKHSSIEARSKNQTSARENEASKDAIGQTAKSCKRHELWLRAGELASRGPDVHTWEVCHRLENWLLEKASEGSRELSLYLTHANSSTFPFDISADELNGEETSSKSSPRSLPTNIPESDLVRDSLYALQGVPAAVRKLERLSRVYCTSSTDKSNLTTLWTRSVTASALGKVLSVVARAGHVRCQLDSFVRFFLDDRGDPLEKVSNEDPKLSRKTYKKKKCAATGNKGAEKRTRNSTGPGNAPVSADLEVPRHCLVNQAFAAAVKGILRGHSAALNTLATSISLRRDQDTGCNIRGGNLGEQDPDPGPVIGYGNRDITLLEFYLHTRELRVQLHSLAFICLMREGKSFVGRTISDACREEDSMDTKGHEVELGLGNRRKSRTKGDVKANCDPLVQSFEKFPRGADLLTYLYDQLMEVDPLHMELLRFLFESAYEPYSIFVESWLYQAAVRDPYGEFIIEQADFSVASSSSKTSGTLLADPHSRDLKLRSGICVPRFMENICSPLIRAGEQLQVLLKIADTCELAQQMANNTRTSESFWPQNSRESLKESREGSAYLPALVFSKRKLEENANLRERKSQEMSEKFDILFTDLASRHSMGRSRASSLSGTPKSLSVDADNFEIEDNQVLLADPETRKETSKEPLSNISGIQDVRDTKHLEVTVTLPKRGWVTSEKEKSATDDCLSRKSRSPWQVGSKDGLASLALKEMVETEIQPACKTADASGLALDLRDPIEQWFNTDPTRVDKGLRKDKGSSEVQSLISGYQRGTSWQLWGLPINPFLVQADVEDSAPNAYVYPNFTGTYQHWDVTAKPTLASVTSCPEKSRGSPRYGKKHNIEPSWFPRLELALNEQLFAGLDAQLKLPSWSQGDVVYAGDEAGQGGLTEFPELQPVKAGLSPTHPLDLPSKGDSGPDAVASSSPVAQSKSSDPQTLIDAPNVLPDLQAETEAPTDQTPGQSAHIENILPLGASTDLESGDGGDGLSPLPTEVNIDSDPSEDDVIEPFPSDVETEESCRVKVAKADEILPLPRLLKLSDLESDEIISRAPNRGIATTTSNISGLDEGKAVHSSQQISSQSWESDEIEGPARWEQHLRFSDAFGSGAVQETSYDCADEDDDYAEEIPLSVVVSKCIAEEILSQYQSVSTLTVRLFQEGLCLQDHYTALRRYYFMERGDWAEYFTTALCQHKWGPLGGQLRQMEVQGMLEAAFQRSSCEGDVYAERVYVTFQESIPYSEKLIHASAKMPIAYVDSSNLDAFDFIALQYRVDWPLSLIITNHSLKLYNVVFTFLLRIKLTVHALGDIWQRLQSIDRSLQKGRVASSSQQQINRFRTLQQFRQQIYHFVVTLQRYVESKLLNVVWSKFLQDVQSEVNDMQDLEIVHRAYLEEATEECFLSPKTRGVKGCIDSVMQCVLDFSSHMRNAYWSREKIDLIDDNLFMQVHHVKKGFQTSLQQLHGYHKKQEPQSRTNLNDLWMILDYNGFLTTALSGPRL